MKNESVSKPRLGKTDYDIPSFSIKSALIIMTAGVISTVGIPVALSMIGLESKMIIVVLNALLMGGALTYTRFFVETKRGITNKFWYTYLGFGASFALITYYWLYLGNYI